LVKSLKDAKAEAEKCKPVELGVNPDDVIVNRKNNLEWDDIKGYLFPVEALVLREKSRAGKEDRRCRVGRGGQGGADRSSVV
jgi:hypothetical protein